MNKVKVISYSDFLDKAFKENGAVKHNATEGLKLPLGISKDSIEYLNISGNVLLCGGIKSGKTNILHNLLVSCPALYTTQSLEILMFDNENLPVGRYIRDGECLHTQMKIVKEDKALEVLEDLVEEMKVRRRTYSFDTVKLLVIDELQLIWHDEEARSLLTHIIALGYTCGVYCILVSDERTSSDVQLFCSDFVIAPMSKCDYLKMRLEVPYITLPLKYGIATHAEKLQDEINVSVLLIPKGDWKEQRDIMLTV